MDFLDNDISKYVEEHTKKESSLLKKLNRETNAKIIMPRMISGHLQGRVLSMLSHMIQPQNILEVGTYTGYSALCLAEGMQKDGILYTIDINEELEELVRNYFAQSSYNDQIEHLVGNAIDIIPELDEIFDLVFIDADKLNYPRYFELTIDKIRPGGFIIADNVLWSGKVLGKNRKKLDKDTEAIVKFNQMVHEDNRVENVLFPIRDGLMVLRKL